MAISNIDLTNEINKWKNAVYGKDVRAANVEAFEKIQTTVNQAIQDVNQASEDALSASENAQEAVDNITGAINIATEKASEAASSAEFAADAQNAAADSASAAAASAASAAEKAQEAADIASGFGNFDGTAGTIKATDTYGIVVEALGESNAQALIDAIANKVMNQLVATSQIVNNLLATVPGNVLDATQGKALGDRLTAAEGEIDQLNSDIGYFFNFRYWNYPNWSDIKDAPTGFYLVTSEIINNIDNIPNNLKLGGRTYILKTAISDEEFCLLISPYSKKMGIGFLYGSDFIWKNVTLTEL